MRIRSEQPKRRGVVLLVVLIAVLMLSLAAYRYSDRMTSEYQAMKAALRVTQSRALAQSGVNYAAAVLADPNSVSGLLNGNPYNNSGAFQNQGSDASGPGKFSLIAPLDPSDPNYASGSPNIRFGVIDESGKINLNALVQVDKTGDIASQILQTLPNMTPDIADAIIDWIDADSNPRPNGAESDYYSSQSPPYQAKNGPLDSLDELLLVRGVTPQLLYGNDRNRNGIIDPDEDDGTDPTQQLGWSAYLTVYSREQDLDSTGNPRIYLNTNDLQTLSNNLSSALQDDDLVNFIIAYRQYGPAASTNTTGGGKTTSTATTKNGTTAKTTTGAAADGAASSGGTPAQGGRLTRGNVNFQQKGSKQISSIYDLIDSKVTIPGQGGSAGTTYNSPLSSKDTSSLQQYLPLLLDKTTVNKPGTVIQPRVNLATAPAAVVNMLPAISSQITATDVQNILANRPTLSSPDAPDPIYQTTAWLITQANLTPAKMKAIDKYVTSRSQVYRVQSVGYFPNGGPAARVVAVFDTNPQPNAPGRPRILFWRDLTELGPGVDVTQLTGK